MAFTQRTLYDAVGSFDLGMNSGIDPDKLPRNQLSNLLNGTVRGQFVRPRAAYRNLTLNFDNDGIRQAFSNCLFQVVGYYKPDVGTETLMLALSGRLFQVTIIGTVGTVVERTIQNDLNSPTAPQNWMWQGEQFLIWNDGTSLPVIFNGLNSYRSLGASTSLGNVTNVPTVPAIGSSVSATLSTAYSGPNNALVELDYGGTTFIYAIQLGSAVVTLTNISDDAASRPVGTVFNYQPGLIGFSTGINGSPGAVIPDTITELDIDVSPMLHQPSAGQTFFTEDTVITNWPPISPRRVYWIVVSSTATTVRATLDPSQAFPRPLPWQVALNNTNQMQITTIPDVTQFVVGITFTPPAIGSDVSVTFNQAFTLPVGTILEYQLDEAKAYRVKTVTPIPTSSTSVLLVNMNDSVNVGSAVIIVNPTPIASVNQLPSGRMGAYWHGRNWMALTDARRFLASDIVLGSSGTAAYSKRDAILYVTENTVLNGGGFFLVPNNAGEIRAIMATALTDQSLGQGPLSILTASSIFSCLAPANRITNGSTVGWQDTTAPLLSPSVIGSGGQSQSSTVLANSDFYYRALDGIRSQILARRGFTEPGNVPQSREVDATLNLDDPSLLPYASGAVFNNRVMMTARPVQSSVGVYHESIIVMNLDPLSALQGKAPPVYDGEWNGLKVLQFAGGKFSDVDRLFAITANEDSTGIEIIEILPTEGPLSETDDDGVKRTVDLRTGSLNFYQTDPRERDCLRLLDGEIFIDEMTEDVTFTAYYQPDQWTGWVQWRTWVEKFDPTGDPGFRPRMGLGEPSVDDVDNVNERPLRDGYDFQFRLVYTGNCRFRGARFKAVTIPKPDFAPVSPTST